MSTHPPGAADKLRDLHDRLTPGKWTLCPSSGEFYADSGIGFGEGPLLMADEDDCLAIGAVRNALPDIIAVIAAAEQVRDGWMMWEDGADEAHMTGMINGPLVEALAALNARLTDTSDGGAA